MNIALLGALSCFLYGLSTLYQIAIYKDVLKRLPFVSFSVALTAAILQLFVSSHYIFQSEQVNFSIVYVACLVTGLIVCALLALSIKKPINLLLAAQYPIALLSVIALLFIAAHPSEPLNYTLNAGILVHVVLSITAYTILSIAAVQAALITLQIKNLKTLSNKVLLRKLPPLTSMESLLFEMLWSGTIVLSLALVIGFVFIDDFFAQTLAHKTFFSLLSWAVFVGLLIGHHVYGWRGIRASYWTLWGCLLLMLAYFGSKFVVEVLLA